MWAAAAAAGKQRCRRRICSAKTSAAQSNRLAHGWHGRTGWKSGQQRTEKPFEFCRPPCTLRLLVADRRLLGPRSEPPSRAATSMDDDQRFLLDLQGYLVIPSLLSRDQVAAANAAVDHHFASAPPIRRGSADPSAGGLLSEESPGLVGQQGRAEFYGFLGWPAPHCDLFRELMVRETTPLPTHPRDMAAGRVSHPYPRPPRHLRCRSTRPCSRSCWNCWTTVSAWITCTASG